MSGHILSRRPAGRPDWVEQIDIESRIRAAIAEGLTDRPAAIKVGVSDKTIWRYRHAHDIPPNTTSGTRRDTGRSTR